MSDSDEISERKEGSGEVQDDGTEEIPQKRQISKAKRRMEEINRNKLKSSSAAAAAAADTTTSSIEYHRNIVQDEECSIDQTESLMLVDVSSCWAHDSYPPITGPRLMEYCPACGLPPDYCEFSDTWETGCKPWTLEHYPQYYPNLVSESSRPLSSSLPNPTALTTNLPKTLGKLIVETSDGAEKKKAAGKKGNVKPPGVTIQRVSRAKNKTVTVVIGLDTLGVKMDKASKLFSKRFSCGASVVKGGSGLPDQIDIQGDVGDMLSEVLMTNFPEVTVDKINFLRSK